MGPTCGDACRTCDGVGTIRVRGLPGYQRIPCPACGGCGHMHTRSRF